MKQDVKEFLESLNINQLKNEIGKIKNYLQNRIDKKITCNDEEIEYLQKFIITLKTSLKCSQKNINKIIIKIAKLIVISKDIKRYRLFKNMLINNTNSKNENEIIEYLDIILSYCPYCFDTGYKKQIIRSYLKINNDPKKIYDLIEKHSNLFSEKQIKEMDKYIYNTIINIIFIKILDLLRKKVINSIKLNNYLFMLSNFETKPISNDNLKLFRNIVTELNESDILEKIDNQDMLNEIKEKLEVVYDNLINKNNNEVKVKCDIAIGKIELTNNFPNIFISKTNYEQGNIPFSDSKRIITIDEPLSPDLDGAFSIEKTNDSYIFTVYVSAVPIFLKDNPELCKEAYLRGATMYVRNYENNGNYNIDMLPEFLSHDYLSLNSNTPKNVIAFKFVIGNNGEIHSCTTSYQKIIVTDKLTPKRAHNIIYSTLDRGPIQEYLRNYQDLCRIITQNTSDKYLKILNYNKINDLIAFPSVLTNYYLGYNSNFVIYREGGIYTPNTLNHYTHSVTPIRRFVSNINLAFFLEQNGIVSFPDKDLYYVENHLKEIIDHLNSRDEISKVINRNSYFVRKYVK